MAGKNATQQDIAEYLQVSRSTVAAILRKDPRFSFSDQTRQRVFEAATKLNYQPHFGARSLRGGRTHTLVLAVPQFAMTGGAIQSQNLCGIGEAVQRAGYTLSICSYGTVRQMKPLFERLMRESRFEGVILHGDDACQEDPRESIVEAFGLPCVVLERRSENTPWVDFDHERGAIMATEHLIARGRRRIALVGENHCLRRKGYLAALENAGLPVVDDLIWPRLSGEPYDHVGRGAVEAMFDGPADRPDALVCIADEVACTAIVALAERGIKVPEDVAVIGYDDSKLARYANPPLTSVRQDGVLMGSEAVRLLVQQIEAPHSAIEPVMLDSTLTVRRSCGVKV